MDEIWYDVPAYEQVYQVSTHERVRSMDRIVVDSRGQVRQLRGKILWPKTIQGEPSVALSWNGAQEWVAVSALLASVFEAVA